MLVSTLTRIHAAVRCVLLIVALSICFLPSAVFAQTDMQTIGKLEALDQRFNDLVPEDSQIEVLASGFTWCEGPVWNSMEECLYFSDIPRNAIFRWSATDGVQLFMQPSGYTGVSYYGLEPGSNGLAIDPDGHLLMCEHGDRRVSRLTKGGGKMTIVDSFEGKRLNSPNDLVIHSSGDLYFTDPPYGLPNRENDPSRELDHFGVYRYSKTRQQLDLLTSELARPNGLGFSPDESILYVAQSDPKRAIWMRYSVLPDGRLGDGSLFFDATEFVGRMPGLPDGLTVDSKGNVWATGPGGAWVFDAQGTPLGRINTGKNTSNCCFGPDESILYITADDSLCRIRLQ